MIQPITDLHFFVALAFVPVLLATGLSDLREMRIPNRLSWIGVVLFAATLPLLGFDEWAIRALAGLVTLAICFALFAMGWLGGGDAKILPVTILFVPLSHMELYMFSFSACMILGMVGIWGARRVFAHPEATWVSMKPGAAFPMGISIAASLPAVLAIAWVLSRG